MRIAVKTIFTIMQAIAVLSVMYVDRKEPKNENILIITYMLGLGLALWI